MATLTGGEFVGRQREMAELKGALDEALSGQGQLLMPAGELGTGKTRTAAIKKKVHPPSDPGSSLFALMPSSETRSNFDPKWVWVQLALLRSSPKHPANCPAGGTTHSGTRAGTISNVRFHHDLPEECCAISIPDAGLR
jgi:hypothetical protein